MRILVAAVAAFVATWIATAAGLVGHGVVFSLSVSVIAAAIAAVFTWQKLASSQGPLFMVAGVVIGAIATLLPGAPALVLWVLWLNAAIAFGLGLSRIGQKA